MAAGTRLPRAQHSTRKGTRDGGLRRTAQTTGKLDSGEQRRIAASRGTACVALRTILYSGSGSGSGAASEAERRRRGFQRPGTGSWWVCFILWRIIRRLQSSASARAARSGLRCFYVPCALLPGSASSTRQAGIVAAVGVEVKRRRPRCGYPREGGEGRLQWPALLLWGSWSSRASQPGRGMGGIEEAVNGIDMGGRLSRHGANHGQHQKDSRSRTDTGVS